VHAAAMIGESMDENTATITVMDKSRRIVQVAIYLCFYREGNTIQSSGTLIWLILQWSILPTGSKRQHAFNMKRVSRPPLVTGR
jgi:hypothetical protein